MEPNLREIKWSMCKVNDWDFNYNLTYCIWIGLIQGLKLQSLDPMTSCTLILNPTKKNYSIYSNTNELVL